MKNRTALLILAALFVLLLAGAYLLYGQLSALADSPSILMSESSAAPDASEAAAPSFEPQQEQSEAAERQAAPDFTVYDGEGNAVRLSDLAGKPVVLNFWASWCGPCQSEMPDFDAAFAELGEDIHFMMVNTTDGSRETAETAQSFISAAGYTFPVYFDTAMEASIAYGVNAIPATYFIDADGNAVAWAAGAIDRELLQTGIDMILAE